MTNLAKPWLMYLKAALLALIAMISCGLILMEHPRWHVAGLLVLAVWSSARVYYFMFYVIEKYVDPSFRFSGIASFVRYACSRRCVQQTSDVDDRDRQSST